MANETISPNMSLPVPGVGLTFGPQYAIDIDNCMSLIDQHDHSSGKGVAITPSGLNISADLSIGGNNLLDVKSVRFQIQVAPLAGAQDLACIYASGVDLYYNDANGNQIQITQNGSVAGASGNISGLVSPASASYVALSKTFVWQSDVNTPANMDMGSIIIRNVVAGSNGITISAPGSLSSNYTLTLPSLPATQKFMTLDNTGNIAAVWGVDNSTIEISANNLQVKAGGINTAQLADHSITNAKLAAMPFGTPAAAGGFAQSGVVTQSTSSGTFVDVPGLTVTLTTTGRPVKLSLGTNKAGVSNIEMTGNASNSGTNPTVAGVSVRFVRDAVNLSAQQFGIGCPTPGGVSTTAFDCLWPSSSVQVVDLGDSSPGLPAGTYVYKVQWAVFTVGSVLSPTAHMQQVRLEAYEL